MTSAFDFIISLFKQMVSFLESRVVFELYGFEVSYMGILFAFLVICFVISVFWKGARA